LADHRLVVGAGLIVDRAVAVTVLVERDAVAMAMLAAAEFVVPAILLDVDG
jgi:hypothetical protein